LNGTLLKEIDKYKEKITNPKDVFLDAVTGDFYKLQNSRWKAICNTGIHNHKLSQEEHIIGSSM
jgi:hypothetical protein